MKKTCLKFASVVAIISALLINSSTCYAKSNDANDLKAKDAKISQKYQLRTLKSIPKGKTPIEFKTYEELENFIQLMENKKSDEIITIDSNNKVSLMKSNSSDEIIPIDSNNKASLVKSNSNVLLASSSTKSTSVYFGTGTTLNISASCTLSDGYGPYTFKSINSVRSWLTGQTAIWDWSQNDYQYSISGEKATINVLGVTTFYVITPLGLAKAWSTNQAFQGTIHAN